MNPQEKRQFEELRQQVDRMAQIVQRLEVNDRLPIQEQRIPPHFHKNDRVDIKDLKGGVTILSATPTHVAEEGKCVLFTNSTTTQVAFKVNQVWRTVELN